jgi:hypothetical protein
MRAAAVASRSLAHALFPAVFVSAVRIVPNVAQAGGDFRPSLKHPSSETEQSADEPCCGTTTLVKKPVLYVVPTIVPQGRFS